MKLWKLLSGLVIGASLLASAQAQERATQAEASALVDAAVALVAKLGVEKAAAELTNDAKWRAKGTSIFLQDNKGNCLAHSTNAKLVGKNTLEIKDPSGKAFIKEMTDLAAGKGTGWVSYEFADPIEKKITARVAYVKKVPGFDGFVGGATVK
ncbi:MAG: cache domain-containing protein [Burkholderiaceae bacterium]|nr:cache domain-containing protein [Burkholderiaceae bacterium]MBT9500683.1 cache domain-containing protein [Burkholderiaceae bacterium]